MCEQIKIIYTPLCYKLEKIISTAKAIALLCLAVNIIVGFDITGEILYALSFLFYALVLIAEGCLQRYSSLHLSIKDKPYFWFDELQKMSNFIDKKRMPEYNNILKNINTDCQLYKESVIGKHAKALRENSFWNFVISICLLVFVVIPLLV